MTQVTSKPVAVSVKKPPVNAAKKAAVPPPRLSEDEDEYGTGDDDDFDDGDVLVEQMLTAAKAMTVNDAAMARRLDKALRTMDETDKSEADLADQTFVTYLALYPAWLAYVQAAEPAARESKFAEYQELLKQYEKGQEDMINILLLLIHLQKTLLPSNVLPDPENRIKPALDVADELKILDRP
ncbi:Hypothetical protein CINCED_3A021596 [Cinara cedri]|uniref:Uncharacterized protein n=1 Tax=Cinara cedri TaxID=506608 RepID=A0A5E4M7X0_9HEMI|nr:Hypothetical protein CINCED_3A021596 [Cinara cedri]